MIEQEPQDRIADDDLLPIPSDDDDTDDVLPSIPSDDEADTDEGPFL